jgi:hypothetical protein
MTDTPGPKAILASSEREVTAMTAALPDMPDAPAITPYYTLPTETQGGRLVTFPKNWKVPSDRFFSQRVPGIVASQPAWDVTRKLRGAKMAEFARVGQQSRWSQE